MSKMEIFTLDNLNHRVLVSSETGSPCWGDSGGPSFLETKNKLILIGPLSQGTCEETAMLKVENEDTQVSLNSGFYSNLAGFENWLQRTLTSSEMKKLKFRSGYQTKIANSKQDYSTCLLYTSDAADE